MNIQATVALDKEAHPERYCPARRCLWRTGDGSKCPRHGGESRPDGTWPLRQRHDERTWPDYAPDANDVDAPGYYDHTPADNQ